MIIIIIIIIIMIIMIIVVIIKSVQLVNYSQRRFVFSVGELCLESRREKKGEYCFEVNQIIAAAVKAPFVTRAVSSEE